MSELYPSVPPQQRISPDPTTVLDDELDLSEVAPDRLAVDYSAKRRDNATGTDIDVAAAAGRAERSGEGAP